MNNLPAGCTDQMIDDLYMSRKEEDEIYEVADNFKNLDFESVFQEVEMFEIKIYCLEYCTKKKIHLATAKYYIEAEEFYITKIPVVDDMMNQYPQLRSFESYNEIGVKDYKQVYKEVQNFMVFMENEIIDNFRDYFKN
jgi:hypothetical protein